MDMIQRGKAWILGDRIGIESISPLRFMLDPKDRGLRCLESVDPLFGPNVQPGDILLAGKHFGHGPGHDHAILAIKESGIGGVIAHSFAPQFFRHAVDHGLLIAEYPHINAAASPGDLIEMDFASGTFTNQTRGTTGTALVPQGPANEILMCGGLIPYLQRQLYGS